MARVLIHQFRGGEKTYIEPDEGAMIRRIAEVLARNMVEIQDSDAVHEIVSCFQDAPTIADAEVALELYCDEVPDEKLFVSVVRGVSVEVESPASPLEASVVRMRQYREELLSTCGE